MCLFMCIMSRRRKDIILLHEVEAVLFSQDTLGARNSIYDESREREATEEEKAYGRENLWLRRYRR